MNSITSQTLRATEAEVSVWCLVIKHARFDFTIMALDSVAFVWRFLLDSDVLLVQL